MFILIQEANCLSWEELFMGNNRSFKNFVANRFHDEMYECIQSYITENCKSLDSDLQNVKNIGDAVLSDIEVISVYINDLPEMRIEFNTLVATEVEVRESNYRYDESDNCDLWFMLECAGDLESNLDDFIISSITEYTSKNEQPKPMSDALVPIIKKEELESVATDFLSRHYPEALITPMAINPKELAEKMGLTVEMKNITKDFSIFGQLYFRECYADFYDEENDEMIQIYVRGRSIFVDPKAFFLRNLGTVNNTIVHECVHWDLHRKAFELERLYNDSANRIKCEVVGGIKGNIRDATDWMEWHANALAPRIQMPLSMFKTQAAKLIIKYRRELRASDYIDVMEPVIDALAVFFGVSRIAAKIRMVDAGYEEAIGTFTYINGRYVRPHRFKKGTLKRNQTFSISAEDAVIQVVTNSLLSSLISDGSYQYVDSHFVLNHPKYITQNILGKTELTEYARTHMEECCLIFDLSVRSGVRERYHSECFLNREKTSDITLTVTFRNGYQHASEEERRKLLEEYVLEGNRIYQSLPTDYHNCLRIVREWRGLTYNELADRTLLNERTIRRIIKGEEQGSLNSIILICLALSLPPKISKHIINNSPYNLNFNNDSHLWYEVALDVLFPQSMGEIRTFLQEHGADPL